jgi:hypothetical protein
LLDQNHVLLHMPGGARVGGGMDEVIVGELRFSSTGEPDAVVAKRLNVVMGRTRSVAEGMPSRALLVA